VYPKTDTEQIAEIKADLRDEDDEGHSPDPAPVELSDSSTPFLMLGAAPHVSKDFLLRSLPQKRVVDRLLWHWFNSPDPGLPAIHRPTFLAEYARLWDDSSQTPVMWLAILYGTMALGARIQDNKAFYGEPKNGERPEYLPPEHFQQLAACALGLADYTKPKQYTLEALMIYASCEYMRQDNSQVRLWMFMAVVLRTALRMGCTYAPGTPPCHAHPVLLSKPLGDR
jgi:Fungal specific transcription factor domain